MKKNNWIKSVFVSVSVTIIIMLTTTCKKEEKIVTAPVLSAITLEALADNYAKTKCKITSDGGGEIIECGVCWGLKENPTILDSKTNDGKENGTFISTISGLTAGTTYYVRGYATNPAGTSYSTGITFSTKATLANITTSPVSAISATTATGGGNINYDGGGFITARGVCWGTAANPTISGSKSTDGTGTGSFTSNITGLTPGTLYHVRSYATNSLGTSYGSDIMFSTAAILPLLTTSPVSQITSSSANGGGEIISDGGSPVTVRGICWSINPEPTTADSKTTEGTGTGSFTSSITGLTAGTTYHVRSYATNSVGTSYGSDITFTTLAGLPAVITSQVTEITSSTATCGGNVINNGGAAVTSRGVCWNTTGNPTVLDNKTTDDSGTGNFVSLITNLSNTSMYYVRAYATNSVGVAYGNEISFSTVGMPTDGLIGYWPFNGNASDLSGNSHHGVISGADLTTDRFGISNSAFEFNGLSDYILIEDHNDLSITSNIFSFSYWVYANPGPNVVMGVISKRRFDGLDASNWEYNFQFDGNSGTFTFYLFNLRGNCEVYNGLTSDNSFAKGEWIHYTITSNGTIIKQYKNGILYSEGTKSSTCHFGNGSGPLVFGLGGGWNQMYYFNGKIDDIRLYSRYLSDIEVVMLYNERR